jgi:hypothetical protein
MNGLSSHRTEELNPNYQSICNCESVIFRKAKSLDTSAALRRLCNPVPSDASYAKPLYGIRGNYRNTPWRLDTHGRALGDSHNDRSFTILAQEEVKVTSVLSGATHS